MKVAELKSNVKNPRKISSRKLAALKRSVEKFGDLGAIVWNRRTKTLVSGHQRTKTIPPDASIKIEKTYDTPTKSMTVAEGYIELEGERFKYREVDADETWEAEALLAANRHGGEWDMDLLKVMIADFPKLNLSLAGFELPELKGFGIELPKLKEVEAEQTDEEYVAQTEETEEQISTENLNTTNVVAETKEKAMDVVGRRFVIIIDCSSLEHKDALKEKIGPVVIEAGGKFF